jgi:hypothetical protein
MLAQAVVENLVRIAVGMAKLEMTSDPNVDKRTMYACEKE